jgi:hypothetical protein
MNGSVRGSAEATLLRRAILNGEGFSDEAGDIVDWVKA